MLYSLRVRGRAHTCMYVSVCLNVALMIVICDCFVMAVRIVAVRDEGGGCSRTNEKSFQRVRSMHTTIRDIRFNFFLFLFVSHLSLPHSLPIAFSQFSLFDFALAAMHFCRWSAL